MEQVTASEDTYQVWTCRPGMPISEHQCIAEMLSETMAENSCRTRKEELDLKYIWGKLHGKNVQPPPDFYYRKYGEPAYNIVAITTDRTRMVCKTLYTKDLAKRELKRTREHLLKCKNIARVILKKIDTADDRGENVTVNAIPIVDPQAMLLMLLSQQMDTLNLQ